MRAAAAILRLGSPVAQWLGEVSIASLEGWEDPAISFAENCSHMLGELKLLLIFSEAQFANPHNGHIMEKGVGIMPGPL